MTDIATGYTSASVVFYKPYGRGRKHLAIRVDGKHNYGGNNHYQIWKIEIDKMCAAANCQ